MNALTRCGTVKKSVTGTRMVEVVSGDEPANEALAPEVWPMPAGGPITSFRQIEDECNEQARAIVRGQEPTHRCLLCGTEYFTSGECDWCPVQLTPIMDEAFFQRADAAYERDKASGALDRAREHRALQEQQNRLGTGL